MDRRPLKSRGAGWAKGTAKFIANTGITPNQISILSILMSLGSLAAFYQAYHSKILLVVAALFIQLRLLCNLFDGMVAVEHGKKTNTGDIYNDAPDRFADLFIIMGLSLSVRDMPYAIHLGWAASTFAIMTAYVRVLGRSLGTESYFIGPMAKQHRMFLVTMSALIDFSLHVLNIEVRVSYYVLILIVVGAVFTSLRRLHKIIKDKEAGV